jgi:hypothetical protein
MINTFSICEDGYLIHLAGKHNKNVLVDGKVLEILQRINCKWCSKYDDHTKSFYAYAKNIGGIIGLISMHRFILMPPKGLYVDHINRNTLDNRLINLRIVTASDNAQNRKIRSDCRSGYKGVIWNSKCKGWYAVVKVKGKVVFRKLFKDKELANIAVLEARKTYHPYRLIEEQ